MRVLLISRAMVAASHRARLRELARLGLQLTVLAPHRWEYQWFEPAAEEGYELLSTRARLGWPVLGSFAHHTFFYSRTSPLLTRERWDLVHVDDEPFNFATYDIVRRLEPSGPPLVFTTWQNLMKRYPPPFNLFESRVFARASGAIPGNPETLAVLRRRGFSKPAAVIPVHGVDPVTYRKQDATGVRQRLGLNGSFVAGFIGRLVPEKGLDTLIRATKLLPGNCSLALVGNGPDKPRLEAMVEKLGLKNRVCWVPWIKSNEVAGYMNAFDTLVLPSRTIRTWKEQFGRVLVEAMACETCVVGSDSGEIPNVIGDAGMVFHEGDERELAERLLRLMEDSSLRGSLGRRGRERVLGRYTHAKIAQETFSFYRRVCRGGDLEKSHDSLSDLAGVTR
jgi:glycosyltransferase involved in cell wall biosynthesis